MLARDDDYATAGKPPCDWDDPAAREQLVDELVHDALAALAVLDGETLTGAARDAADLLAIVAGQDVAAGDDGVFRIVRGVARDRVISTVDPEARHGHKSQNRRFDGYKTHASVDPDSELIDDVTVTPANTPDRDAVDDLLADHADDEHKPEVVGDSAYADGDTRDRLGQEGLHDAGQAATGPQPGRPVHQGPLRGQPRRQHRHLPGRSRRDDHPVTAWRRQGQLRCALRHLPAAQAVHRRPPGRSITIHRHEAVLQAARSRTGHPEWADAYRADRPIVERKIAHFARRIWGGRKARCRGLIRITTDVDTRAAAVNLARLAILGVSFDGTSWTARIG